MSRKLLITLHLYLASFFAPFVLLVATSGGLYLLGVKGSVEKSPIYSTIYKTPDMQLDTSSANLKGDVEVLLSSAGVDNYSFEYVKVKGNTLYTRPTSAAHYVITLSGPAVEVEYARPSLQSRMIELHKGHGPTLFKSFQKVFALGLVFIIVSGLWLGLSAERLRRTTLLTAAAGALVFGLLLL